MERLRRTASKGRRTPRLRNEAEAPIIEQHPRTTRALARSKMENASSEAGAREVGGGPMASSAAASAAAASAASSAEEGAALGEGASDMASEEEVAAAAEEAVDAEDRASLDARLPLLSRRRRGDTRALRISPVCLS